MAMKTARLSGNIGLEISAIDLAGPIDDSTRETLLSLWAEHEVLVFRDQDLGAQHFVDFCRLYGDLAENYFFFQGQSKQFPNIAKVVKEAGEALNTGGIWHHDQAYYASPVKGIALYGVDIPSSGGDTLFTSSTLAYAALSTVMQRMLNSLNVVHSTELMLNKKSPSDASDSAQLSRVMDTMPLQAATHPAVCVNPTTGRPFLYINRTTTLQFDGMTREESESLLEHLYRHIEKPEFSCRVKWRPGTLVLWNNHQVLHYAVNDYRERRELHRVHFAAESPLGFVAWMGLQK